MSEKIQDYKGILPGLDEFLIGVNEQAIKLQKADKEKLFSWARGD